MASFVWVAGTASAQTVDTTIYICPQSNGVIKLQNINPTSRCTSKTIKVAVVRRAPVSVVRYNNMRMNDPVPMEGAYIVGSSVSPYVQSQRDAGRAQIVQSELSQARSQLAALSAEYNNGQPERRGDEKNYQKYLDRVQSLKQKMTLTQANVDALQRELARMPR